MTYHVLKMRYKSSLPKEILFKRLSFMAHISAGITVVANITASMAINMGRKKIPIPINPIRTMKESAAMIKKAMKAIIEI